MPADLEPVRQKVRERLERIFRRFDAPHLAEHIEVCIFNHTIRKCRKNNVPRYWKDARFRYAYSTKAQSMLFNLQHPKNPGCLSRVLDGSMGAKKLTHGHPAELFPELWDEVFERVANKQLRKQLTVDINSVPDSGEHKCGKCKSRKTTYTQLQTRSSDEPMTTFVVCLNCQTRWKY